MSKYKFVSMCVSLFCLLITAVLALRTVYADQSVEEDSAVSLDEQANLPLWLQDQPPLPDAQPQTPIPWLPWTTIVIQSFRDENWEIYHIADTEDIRLTNNSASDIQPRLNRGATRIVFASNRDGDYEIYTMNLDGSGVVQLTNNTNIQDGNPSWSLDGNRILFETQRDGQWEVYMMNADGSNQTRLTFDADYDGMPVWSPDGMHIAFVSRRTGGYRIYSMNINGSELMQLSDQPYSFDPTWSPDGSLIAFDADGDGDGWQDMWVMSADGVTEYVIRNPYGQGEAWPRAWSPNSRYIAYTDIYFIIQNGTLYWTSAQARFLDMQQTEAGILAFDSYAWNPDWQTTDAGEPESMVNPLPFLSRGGDFRVSWGGSDQLSGVAAYDVQYRIGEDGAWTNWQMYTSDTSAEFTALNGKTVYFRSRAYDQANNVESWPIEADTFTTFYSWQLSGEVTDNRGVVLPNVPIGISPAPMNGPVTTDGNGRYHTLLLAGSTHTIDIIQPGYGDFIVTPIKAEETSQVYLPPADNLFLNNSFEFGTTNWGTGGTIPIAPIYTTYNTGDTAISTTPSCFSCLTSPESLLNPASTYLSPNTVTDTQGNLHLVFKQLNTIYYSMRNIDGEWSTPTQIPNSTASFEGKLLIGIDNDNTIHVVWNKDNGTLSPQLYYAQKSRDGSWSVSTLVAENYGWVQDMVVDTSGNLHVIGHDPGLYYLERSANGVWSTAVQLNESDVIPDGGSALAVTLDNTIHVVWNELPETPLESQNFFYRQRSPQGIWLTKQKLYSDLNYSDTHIKGMVADAKGMLHLFWGEPYFIHYTTRHPVTGWLSTPTQVPDADEDIDVVIDDRNIIHLVSFAEDSVYYQYLNLGETWSATELIDSGTPLLLPSVTADNFGAVHLVWENGSNGLYYATTETADSPSTGYLQQTVTIPADMLNPTLSFMYKTSPDLPDDDTALVVSVTAGITTTQVYTAAPAGNWTLGWVDMQAWAGQTVTVRFAVQQAADDPYLQLFLDSVSLGAAHSDLWVGGTGVTTAEPGDEVVYQLHYGNAGGAGAEDVSITYTLPAEITFVSASVPPITPTTQALVWELGSLPAGDGPYSITITGTVAANVPYLTELTNTAVITAAAPELRTANNTAVSITFIGRLAYLPVMFE